MEARGVLEYGMLINIIIATIAGFLSRWSLLRVDFRQYPTYPNGYLIHLAIGFIASSAGAIAVPALLSKNFTAVTFLLLAIQQFRDVRKMEKSSLQELDKSSYFPRGPAYIDGIAKTFESRNYLAMVISLITIILLLSIPPVMGNVFKTSIALLVALSIHLFISRFSKGRSVKDAADVEIAKLSFKENNLYVDDIFVTNIGLEENKRRILKNGIGVVLKPKGRNQVIQLQNIGQRQAIMHECSRLLGLENYIESVNEYDTGRIAMYLIPIRKEPASLVKIIENVPLLESLKKQAQKVGDTKYEG
ncbi:MAG: YIEGIA domain-containing protein [Bacillota bacterium]